jgi:hypothetical protein
MSELHNNLKRVMSLLMGKLHLKEVAEGYTHNEHLGSNIPTKI